MKLLYDIWSVSRGRKYTTRSSFCKTAFQYFGLWSLEYDYIKLSQNRQGKYWERLNLIWSSIFWTEFWFIIEIWNCVLSGTHRFTLVLHVHVLQGKIRYVRLNVDFNDIDVPRTPRQSVTGTGIIEAMANTQTKGCINHLLSLGSLSWFHYKIKYGCTAVTWMKTYLPIGSQWS